MGARRVFGGGGWGNVPVANRECRHGNDASVGAGGARLCLKLVTL